MRFSTFMYRPFEQQPSQASLRSERDVSQLVVKKAHGGVSRVRGRRWRSGPHAVGDSQEGKSIVLGVVVQFIARPGMRAALAAHLAESAVAARDEPGTILFTVAISPTEPDVVWAYEVYADEAAQKAHESTSQYAAARRKTGDLLGAEPHASPLSDVVGKGVPS